MKLAKPSRWTDIQWQSQSPQWIPDRQLLQWVETILQAESVEPASLTLRIVDEVEMRVLNHCYRRQNKATNVLAFPYESPEFLKPQLLGDIVICAPILATEASKMEKTPVAHWAHILCHGILHLLGYRHDSDEEAIRMEFQEKKHLNRLGFTLHND